MAEEVLVTGPLGQQNPGLDYPTHHAALQSGGWREVANTTERDAIPVDMRRLGMTTYDRSTRTAYDLIGDLTNGSWKKAPFSYRAVLDVADIAERDAIPDELRYPKLMAWVRSEEQFYKLENDLETWSIHASGGGGGGGGGGTLTYVVLKDYSAVGNGVANDTVALQNALTAAASSTVNKELVITAGTYLIAVNTVDIPDGVTIRFTSGAVLAPLSHPTSGYTSEEFVNGLLRIGNRNRFIGVGEKHITGRRGVGGYESTIDTTGGYFRDLAMIWGKNKTDLFVDGCGIGDTYSAQIFLRACKRVRVQNSLFTNGIQCMHTFICDDVRFLDNRLTDWNSTYSLLAAGVFMFSDGNNLDFNGNLIDDIYATAGPSYAASIVNVFGANRVRIVGNRIEQMRSGTTKNPMGLILDGLRRYFVSENQLLANWGSTNSIAIEGGVQGYICNNFISGLNNGTGVWNGTDDSTGIYFRNASISDLSKKGGHQWRQSGLQTRGDGGAFDLTIENNTIENRRVGIYLMASNCNVRHNIVRGCYFAGIRFEVKTPGGPGDDFTYYWSPSFYFQDTINLEHNLIENNRQGGILFNSGNNVNIRRNIIRNNAQGGGAYYGIQFTSISSATLSAGTTTQITTSGLTADAHRGRWLYLPASDSFGYIIANTTTTIDVHSDTPLVAPTNGDTYVILTGHAGRVSIVDNEIYDNQTAKNSGVRGFQCDRSLSLDPTQTISASAPFLACGPLLQHITTGQRLTLEDVMSDGSDMTVEVVGFSEDYADGVLLLPISPTSGSFKTSTGGAVIAGTGTMSHTTDMSGPYDIAKRTAFTGSGTTWSTSLTAPLYNNMWIGVNGEWIQVRQTLTNTTGYFMTPVAGGTFSAQSYVMFRCSVLFTGTQRRAIDVRNSPAKCDIRDNKCFGNTDGNPQIRVDLATAPDAIPRITDGSATPVLAEIFPIMRFTGAAATLTDLRNASHGVTFVTIFNGNQTLGFASGGTKLKGNGGVNVTPVAGRMGRWTCVHDTASTTAYFWHVTLA